MIRRNNETIGIECGDQFNEEEWKREKEGRGVYRDRDKKIRSVGGHKISHEAEFKNAAVVIWDLRSLILVRQHYQISQDNNILTPD